MSRWTNDFEDHAIHETLRQIHEWADTPIENIDSDHLKEKRRFIKIIDRIIDMIANIDPEIISKSDLGQINNYLKDQNIWNNLDNYKSSHNIELLRLANDQISGQISRIFALSGLSMKSKAIAATSAVEGAYDNFVEVVEKREQQFIEKVETNTSDLAELDKKETDLRTAMEELKIQIENAISGWQNEFTKAELERTDAVRLREDENESRFDDFLENAIGKAEKGVSELTKSHLDQLGKLVSSFSKKIDIHEKDIEEKHQSILEIHELVATDGIAGSYKKYANDERKAANLWRFVSLGCYSVILLWVLFKGKLGFGIATNGQVDWPTIVTTVSVTAVMFVAAQFTSHQSRMHRLNEQRMRWFALEVKAIDPFISSLPQDIQNELKKQLSERLFGQNSTIDEKSKSGVEVAAVTKIAQAITIPLKEVMKNTGKP